MINDLWSEKKDKETPIDDNAVKAMTGIAHQLEVFNKSLIKEGFTKEQAFDLTKAYMVTILSNVAQPTQIMPIGAINK